MNTFSAKDLVTRSCMQIRMLAEHPERKQQPSQMVEYGEKFQRAVADTITNVIGEEMRGTYTNGCLSIHFSNDIVCPDKIIEVKSVVGNAPEWYLRSSVLQCAFYKSMIMQGFNHLETASFLVNQGYERKAINVLPWINYVLIFGEEKFKVEVENPNAIINFFLRKAEACTDWNLAKNFDFVNKHREYEILSDYFKYYMIF
jgi:hypothetical protein